jgi:nucleotide-binding universal stress UspA family protein
MGSVPFTTIAAVLDLHAPAEGALGVVAGLARGGAIPVELLTVLRPDEAAAPAMWQLERRAQQRGLRRTTCYGLHGESPARAIVDHVSGREGTLLVIATSGTGAWGENQLDPVTEAVLEGVRQPVMVVGPGLRPWAPGPLVVAVDDTGIAGAAMPVVAAWVRTVPLAAPRLVTVIPPGAWPADGADASPAEMYVDLLDEHGIAASAEVLRELEAAPALAAHASAIQDAVMVVTSPRSRDRASHWYGTTRALIRAASCPVLVVPADRAGLGSRAPAAR